MRQIYVKWNKTFIARSLSDVKRNGRPQKYVDVSQCSFQGMSSLISQKIQSSISLEEVTYLHLQTYHYNHRFVC
jgi:hypothetical protein